MGYLFDALNRAGAAPSPAPAPAADLLPNAGLDRPAQPEPVLPDAAAPVALPALPEAIAQPTSPAPVSAAATTEAVVVGEPVHPSDLPPSIDERVVVLTDPMCGPAEEYRAIRTSLLARWQHRRQLVHTITSATPQEGKTITSLNLGFCFAELRSRRTIVLEADLRLPTWATLLKLPQTPGLVGLLENQVPLADCVCTIPGSNLTLLPVGSRAPDRAVQLLSSNAMADLIKQLRSQYDHVIIDTPPVIELADAGILGALSDDVLLVARLGRTPRTLIETAIRTLGSYNAPVAGIIATDQPHYGRHYYYRKYGYRYGGRYYSKRAKAVA